MIDASAFAAASGQPGTSAGYTFRDQVNKQKQTQYAAQNGMNTGGPAATQQPASTANATGSSPVTPNGKINQAVAPAPPPPAPPMDASQAAAAGLGWVPQNHPAYGTAGFVGSQAAVAPQQAALQGALQAPTGATLGGYGAAPQVMGPNGLPVRQMNTEWRPGMLPQYESSRNAGLEASGELALERALAATGLPVGQLKGTLKDHALTMRDSELAASRDRGAASGRLSGGFQANQERNIRGDALDSVLSGYRDIDIANAQAENENAFKGAALASDFMNAQTNRGISDQAAGLQSALSQENLYKEAGAEGRANYLADLQGVLGKMGIDQQGNVAQIGASADKYRADRGFAADLLNIMERARSSDQSTGLGYSQLMQQLIGGIR